MKKPYDARTLKAAMRRLRSCAIKCAEYAKFEHRNAKVANLEKMRAKAEIYGEAVLELKHMLPGFISDKDERWNR